MTTATKTKFEPGEWTVLRNDSGGRLFHIHSVLPSGELTEVNSIPSQQQYATAWWPRFFIKVASKEDAVAMVAAFTEAEDVKREAIAAIKSAFDRRVSRIIDRYSVDLE